MDILIKGGLIVDGTGEKPFYGDIAIDRDMITEIGENLDASKARKVVDARGLTVTPGFIDGHTHSELNILKNRQHPNALYQGISTVVTGQCGLGFAPMKPELFEDSIKINSGIFGDYRHYLKDWTTFGEFLNQLDGSGVNVAANVSHNAIRQMVTGFENMVWGEKERRELFCVHQRLDDGQVPLRPRYEAAEIARKTGVRLNMLHYRTGSMEEDYRTLFEPFKDIEAAGNKVYYEYYPYMVGAGLVLALVPGWAQQGSYAEIMERLTSKELRGKLLKDMDERHKYFFGPDQTATVILTKDPYSRDLGKTFARISEENHETFSETIIRLLVENELQVGFAGVETQSEELKKKLYDDQYKLFMDDRYTIGSDTIPAGMLCHPRGFGSFARIIAYMRERNVPVEYIVKKLTSMPAEMYHLEGRGVLKAGMKADICLMDYENVKDQATFEDPRQRATGVEALYINGLPALEHGNITGILAGHALRRGEK